MVPTARAPALAAQARRALDALEALLVEPEDFVPADAEQRFRIASPDYIAPSMDRRLAQHVGAEAPRCRIELRALGPTFDFERALADDELDLVIGNWPVAARAPAHLAAAGGRTGLPGARATIRWPGRDAARRGATTWRPAHVVPMPYAMAQRGVVETHLGERRARRATRACRCLTSALAPSIAAQHAS